MTPLELWGGIECTVNRVGDHFFDQVERSGHANRPDDIERVASLGLTAIRYPLLWERVAPQALDRPDWRWTDDRLARLRAAGVNPIAGLVHHGSGPAYTSLVAPDFPQLLAEYARLVATRYPWILDWTPVNEPLTTARFSGLYGHWYPHGRDDTTFVRTLLNQLRGTVLAMREIRRIVPNARLIQTEDLGRTFGTHRMMRQVEHECHRRWLTWDLLCGRVDARHPMYGWLRRAGASAEELAQFRDWPCPPDVIGVNYYVTSDRWLDERHGSYPPWSRGGNGYLEYADVEAVRSRARGIVGHEKHLLAAWKRYRLPVALTEVHLGGSRDEQLRWLIEAWRAAERAVAKGADVRAVTAWALLGSFDWDSLVTQARNHYEPGLFDVRAPKPRPTSLARTAVALASGGPPGHPWLGPEGWWRRPSRLTWGPAASAIPNRPPPGPPILVLGGSGTLGRAFRRVCAERGLRLHLTSRADLDATDPIRLDGVLRAVRPWAVVNAAGYVRVDDAESDRDQCWRDNVTAPANLAAACRRRGLRLVTFSTDLVFDGRQSRPYVEQDVPSPLNVYGESKAEAERRVLELLPTALVIRTSAFFGPWDPHNFATHALKALRGGHSFQAADDSVVSPTYVPDLVHAALDLLIDGEHGVWHLANDGAVTWSEFASLVARAAGVECDKLQRCSWRDVWQPAARPPYSVLGTSRGQILRPLKAAVDAYLEDVLASDREHAARRATS
jgi:dTDP-4-dehydrorhamnose reductase